MELYEFKKIEAKWQCIWDESDFFKAVDFHPTKPKYYVLYEFYNISGNLHMGHLKGTVPADALARYKRFNGFNVLFPIGGDAFGLPAENAAIKNNITPIDFVAEGMQKVIDQSKKLGLSFDWSRTICTSDPEYYKWTQWIFLQLFKNGKAYKKKGVVNYCPNCKTVLSNEDSQGGICDRCQGKVLQEERWGWFLKMKEYSEKLLDNVELITMSENLKEAQRNWIGKSEGVQIAFDLVNEAGKKISSVEIYTTCIETIFGVTFIVLAPEHKLICDLKDDINNFKSVDTYRQKTAQRSALDRMAEQNEKTGCLIEGIYARHPLVETKIPIYAADFVLANYGTGAIMAVPAHDQRDFEFAQNFNIPMIQVISGDCSEQAVEKKEYTSDNRKMLNSGQFTGMLVHEAKCKISEMVLKMGIAIPKVNYKMQDWSFNRQRYWGEPFPVVYCDDCGTVSLEESDLPLMLPVTKDFSPNENGDSPLSKIDDWVKCTCPRCGKAARRETDTMPNWAGSSWYWLRYADPHNKNELADFKKLEYWGSVDCYTGGTEHITRHVLYAFFWQNFLYDIGVVPTRNPFLSKMGSGLILDDEGKKMSKSSTNGVSPLEVIETYGADTARLHLQFLGGYEDSTPWTYNGIDGITSFLSRVWNLPKLINGVEISDKHVYDLNRLIKKVSKDIEELNLNTAIAAFMSFIKKIRESGYITKDELRIFLVLLNPLAPYITSEIFEKTFFHHITDESWPKYDEKYLMEDVLELPIQINGRKSKTIFVKSEITKEQLLEEIDKKYPEMKPFDAKKIIYVPQRIVNIIK